MKLSYEAFDRSGKLVRGVIECSSREEAAGKLHEEGLYVSEFRAGGVAEESAPRSSLPSIKRLKGLSLVARQLALLISTGTPIVEALRAIERQVADPKWRVVLSDVRARVEDGSPLSEALAAHPKSFDAVARSLVHAGEAGGTLEEMLRRLATLTRQQEKLVATVMGSMLYPAVLIVVSVAVLVLMLTYVLPKFTSMFEALDAPLPATTQFLMVLSDGLRSYWWAVPPALVGLGFVAWQMLTTDGGRRKIEWALLHGPLVGKIARSLMVSRMVRMLGVLLEAKVPLLEALQLARESIPCRHFKNLLSRAETDISQGESLSTAFARDGFVPASVAESIQNGERTGRLGNVLASLGDFMDEDNELIVRSLSTIIEPVILIGLGILVGFVAISMFLPLFDLTTMTQQGAH
jgi:type II secretory pathway component PulF